MVRKTLMTTLALGAAAGLLVMAWGPAGAQTGPATRSEVKLPPDVKAKADKALAQGAKFLLSTQQADGSWSGQFGPAITAMSVKALIQQGQPVESLAVRKAVDFILSKQIKPQPQLDQESNKMSGSFSDQALANYNTAICLSTLVLVNQKLEGKPYDKPVKDALAFLRRDQWDESEGIDKSNAAYGGFGYGGGQRPDMSNTNTTMDALRALQEAGYISQDDPMFDKVRVFVERSQNRSESNNVGTFKVGDDGGFIYTPAVSPTRGGAESKAGEADSPEGKSRLRSYGSMTYAGFKSYVYSGLKTTDPRVRDAMEWIRKNYTWNENPGVGQQGLFYYYHTAARALAVSGQDNLKDAANVSHDWRAELIAKLAATQRDNGSWVNEKADRWEEGNPVLATCFAMLALEAALGNNQ